MQYLFPGQGVVTFMVPYEFEVSLSVVGDDVTLPWRLVSMKILVGNSLPGIVGMYVCVLRVDTSPLYLL